MDPTLKTSLVAALRSGKYIQGQSLLKFVLNGICRHCTLGVAYELQGATWDVEQEDDDETWYTPKIAGKVFAFPHGMTRDEAYLIARLNDGWESENHLRETLEDRPLLFEKLLKQYGACKNGLNFAEMADFLETHL